MADKKKSTKTAGTNNKKAAKPVEKQSGEESGSAAEAVSSQNASSKSSTKEKAVSELIAVLAERTDLPKNKTKEFVETYSQLLIEELQSAGSVQLAGIGKLKVNERAERQGRNPATGEAITIKASKQVKFAGGKAFKEKFQ